MNQYKIKVNGKLFDVEVEGLDENALAKVSVNGRKYDVELETAESAGTVQTSAVQTPVPAAAAVTPKTAPSNPDGKLSVVTTPLPGVIVGINVSVGDHIEAGTSVAVLEAMKMENAIEAEVSGTVREIHVQKGDSVLEGAKIVTIG